MSSVEPECILFNIRKNSCETEATFSCSTPGRDANRAFVSYVCATSGESCWLCSAHASAKTVCQHVERAKNHWDSIKSQLPDLEDEVQDADPQYVAAAMDHALREAQDGVYILELFSCCSRQFSCSSQVCARKRETLGLISPCWSAKVGALAWRHCSHRLHRLPHPDSLPAGG